MRRIPRAGKEAVSFEYSAEWTESGKHFPTGSARVSDPARVVVDSDSKLLYDGMRLMIRILKRLQSVVNTSYVNHSRRAKRHWFAACPWVLP